MLFHGEGYHRRKVSDALIVRSYSPTPWQICDSTISCIFPRCESIDRSTVWLDGRSEGGWPVGTQTRLVTGDTPPKSKRPHLGQRVEFPHKRELSAQSRIFCRYMPDALRVVAAYQDFDMLDPFAITYAKCVTTRHDGSGLWVSEPAWPKKLRSEWWLLSNQRSLDTGPRLYQTLRGSCTQILWHAVCKNVQIISLTLEEGSNRDRFVFTTETAESMVVSVKSRWERSDWNERDEYVAWDLVEQARRIHD